MGLLTWFAESRHDGQVWGGISSANSMLAMTLWRSANLVSDTRRLNSFLVVESSPTSLAS